MINLVDNMGNQYGASAQLAFSSMVCNFPRVYVDEAVHEKALTGIDISQMLRPEQKSIAHGRPCGDALKTY